MPAACEHLFAYGTLMFAPIFATVCGHLRPGQPARLLHHARYRLRGAPYPGLVPQADACTLGVLYSGLDAGDWHRLDAFEGEHYARTPVDVENAAGSVVSAATYVIVPQARALLEARAWSPDAFARRHLADYLDACRAGNG